MTTTAPSLPPLPADHLAATQQPAQQAAQQPALEYHRMAHLEARSSRWWRPLAVFGSAALFTVAVAVVVLVGVLVAVLATPPAWSETSANLSDPRNPADLLVMFGGLGVLLIPLLAAMRRAGGLKGTYHSVAGRFRWNLFWPLLLVLLPVFAALHWGTLWLTESPATPVLSGSLIACFVIAVAVVPFQCAAEEYAFRALPQQAFGTWLRSPLWGIVAPVPLFVLGHGYNWVGQIGIVAFALCAGFLAWKTGGIEASIVVHVVNNLTLVLMAIWAGQSLEQGAVPVSQLVISLSLLLGVTAGITVWVSRRYGISLREPVRGRGQVTAG